MTCSISPVFSVFPDLGNIFKTTSNKLSEGVYLKNLKPEMTPSNHDNFSVFDPSTWPHEMQDLHCLHKARTSIIIQKYEVIQLDRYSTQRKWTHLKQAEKCLKHS